MKETLADGVDSAYCTCRTHGATVSSPAELVHPGGPRSLWDIINFVTGELCHLLHMLRVEEQRIELYKQPSTGKESLNYVLDLAKRVSEQLEFEAAIDRLKTIETKLRFPMSTHDLQAEIRVLRETIETATYKRYFYFYSQKNAGFLLSFKEDWKAIIAVDPAIKNEAHAAVDCYAINHHNASVFHLMRAMEIGVRLFGKKLGVNFIKKIPGKKIHELTWEQILNELNPKIKAMSQKTAAQKRKFERYSAIQSYLYGVKDAWRNPTMHPRDEGYNALEAENIMNHVRSFMTVLAGVLK